MFGFGKKIRDKVTANGRSIYLFREIDDAFSEHMSSEYKAINFGFKILEELQQSTDINIKKNAESLHVELDQISSDMKNKFKMIYIAYSSDPFVDNAIQMLYDEIGKISRSVDRLRGIQLEIEKLAKENQSLPKQVQ